MADFIIEQPKDKLYIHFNPQIQQYIVGNTIKGAAVFKQTSGQQFIQNSLNDSWKLTKIKPKQIVMANRQDELQYYRQTH